MIPENGIVVMAQCLCEFDLIIKESRGLVATSSDVLLPNLIKEFNNYIDNVRAITQIIEIEPVKKGKLAIKLLVKEFKTVLLYLK